MASGISEDFKKEIPHIIVLAILVFILLFVVTKFKWVHCSQVPGDWCAIYCRAAGNSRVGIIHGEGGMGDPDELSRQITKNRIYTYVEPLPMDRISYGVLKGYELVIVEGARRISPLQVNALRDYASAGGSLLWVGDSGTEHYLTSNDLQDALNRNESDPGYYERLIKKINQTKGFGDTISQILQVNYKKNEEADNLTLSVLSKDHAITKGLVNEFPLKTTQIAVVNRNSAGSDALAFVFGTKECTKEKQCSAIVANRYSAPVAYVAFPLEEAGSPTLLSNMMDYLVTC
ncbi:MAG TPA: hypothetical protein VJI13_02725 [Candidatus Norongarragalinales archaeon]|nr:hypothetical protein [Candidatus Norongarragalinales archaeon]